VRTDLDDLVIALYVTIDELLGPRRGPGHPPKLSDAELVCLAVAQVLLGARSERHWPRFVRDRLGHLFPMCPARPATTSACAPPPTHQPGHPPSGDAIAVVVRRVAAAGRHPLPCGQSRETVKRSALWPMPPTAMTAATAAGTGA
jgi:hypothetical protein